MKPLPQLQTGDCLLYFDCLSPVDWVIASKTWCGVSHVEVYAGMTTSFASRNGIGVNRYPLRTDGLAYVLRPKTPFDMKAALEFFASVRGTKYGWLDLFKFFSINLNSRGLICSQFGDLLYRAAGIVAFNTSYDAGAVSPRDFLVSPMFETVWRAK